MSSWSLAEKIKKSYKNSKTDVYGYNPALFWVLSVSCWCLRKLIFKSYDEHCSILLAEFILSTCYFYDYHYMTPFNLNMSTCSMPWSSSPSSSWLVLLFSFLLSWNIYIFCFPYSHNWNFAKALIPTAFFINISSLTEIILDKNPC